MANYRDQLQKLFPTAQLQALYSVPNKTVLQRWSMTNFKSAVPVFAVADVAATARWYQQHFGFDFDHFPQHEPWEWAAMFRDSVEIMLQRVPNHKNPDLDKQRAGGVWDAYIRIREARPLYESVKDKMPIRRPPCPMPYGELEFEVRDLNGYVLVFAERMEE